MIDDDTQYGAADGSGGVVINASSLLAIFTPPSDGSYTFSVNNSSYTKKTIAVIRTYKG